MTLTSWTVFVGTVLIMMSTPGPSHLLMLSTSTANGFKRSLATAAGDLTANAIQMGLAGFGLAAVLAASSYGFTIIKWGGVAYLVGIGVRMILASFTANAPSATAGRRPLFHLWTQGFLTSAANPKAVVFFAALFPQFIDQTSPLLGQIVVLGATYIVIDGLFLCAYGLGASWLARRLNTGLQHWVGRFAGATLIGAAVLLGLKESPK